MKLFVVVLLLSIGVLWLMLRHAKRIADENFATAQALTEELNKRVEQSHRLVAYANGLAGAVKSAARDSKHLQERIGLLQTRIRVAVDELQRPHFDKGAVLRVLQEPEKRAEEAPAPAEWPELNEGLEIEPAAEVRVETTLAGDPVKVAQELQRPGRIAHKWR